MKDIQHKIKLNIYLTASPFSPFCPGDPGGPGIGVGSGATGVGAVFCTVKINVKIYQLKFN